jgi:uncharacterized membrane-anchored protein
MRSVCRGVWLLLALLACAPAARAQSNAPAPATTEQERREEFRAAWAVARAAAIPAPARIALLGQAHLNLPPDTAFIPPDPATRLLRSWGNRVAKPPAGLIVGRRDEDRWAEIVRFVGDGYIKDDDALHWNANALLDGLRRGTEAANPDRRTRGFPELEVVGWIAPPSYDATTHRLISSVAVRNKGTVASDAEGVNFFTYALGRDGYFSFDLLTSRANVEHDRAAAAPVADGLAFDDGHRYADFKPGTDHVAAYGLAALIGVVAVKKLGLLALAGAFALKFAKLGVVAAAVLGGVATRLFRRDRSGGGTA